MAKIYHNTTGLGGRELHQAIKQTATQDKKILDFFQANPNRTFTRSEVLNKLIAGGILSQKTQNSSISRAFNTLEKRNLLHRTGEKRTGDFGRIQEVWTLTK
jgi:hypothetical protein